MSTTAMQQLDRDTVVHSRGGKHRLVVAADPYLMETHCTNGWTNFEFFSAPQIRSHDFWRYINLYVCMYAEHGPRSVCPVGRQQQ